MTTHPRGKPDRAAIQVAYELGLAEQRITELERGQPMEATQPARRNGGIVNFLIGLVCLAMIVAFAVVTARELGFLGSPAPSAPVLPPTAIIRVIAPQPQSEPAVRQPVVAPTAVPAPAMEQQPALVVPTAPPARQVIIIKQAGNPGAAPVVIDRGTKRKSP